MQLIINSSLISKKDINTKKIVSLISNRPEIINRVSEQIRITDDFEINEVRVNIFEKNTFHISASSYGVIIDIASHTDIDAIKDLIKTHIPRVSWCIIIGDNDSISNSQRFIEQGLVYLQSASQIDGLAQRLKKGIQIENDRKAFFISVFGCRGGVGTTLISFHLANAISEIKKSPTLLIQGNNGSQDLDLLSEKKIDQDTINYNKDLDLMLLKEKSLDNINESNNKKHNFIIFDQSIYNTNTEELDEYIKQSHCIIILLDHSMVSVRVAKKMIKALEKHRVENDHKVRLILCLNENRPLTNSMLSNQDIQSLLEMNINDKINYINKPRELCNSHDYFGKKNNHIKRLAKRVLAIDMNNNSTAYSLLNKMLKFTHK
ncbi:pilus assembly protein CpaE [Yersinia ruckeri]|uniref:pilus assembly protein CpaE n=1 Tax=Yersinia ruckeri TaxID=29486 RepID=UPI0005ACAA00|nr:pilus assembly protein CpaE [Yersinia ruckeri]MCW6567512.1 pilus assembly protein CpaE [Yersinia ruckeri]